MSQIPLKFVTLVGAANGLATLDGSGKIPSTQLPSTVLTYQGLWDPTTNTPALQDITGTPGFVYQISAAFAGPIVGLSNSTMVNFLVGNLVIYSTALSQWEQAASASGVVSVNGAQGVVVVNAINQLTGDVTATVGMQLYKNGSAFQGVGVTNTAFGQLEFSINVALNAGDFIDIRPTTGNTYSGGTLSSQGTGYISIFLLQNSQTSPGANGVVAASYYLSANFSSSATIPINFDTKLIDTAGAVTTSATAWKFTAPTTGLYSVGGLVEPNTATQISIYKNGSFFLNYGSNSGTYITQGSALVPMNAGDFIDFRAPSGSTVIGGAPSNASNTSFIMINLLQSPSQNAANSASVNARYFASATTISGSLATVVWTTKDFDSNSGMSSGVYTIPVSGKYQINTALAVNGTLALNSTLDLQLQKNGTAVSEQNIFSGGIETGFVGNISDIVNCLAGDTIRVQVSTSAVAPSIVSSNTKNYFSISIVGN